MPATSGPETVYKLQKDSPVYVSHAGNAGIIGCETLFGVEATCIAVSCLLFIDISVMIIFNESFFLCCSPIIN